MRNKLRQCNNGIGLLRSRVMRAVRRRWEREQDWRLLVERETEKYELCRQLDSNATSLRFIRASLQDRLATNKDG